MDKALPRQVDTVIVGNGPSALIQSYILHGHVPVYDLSSPHPDHLLHSKLKETKDLLSLDVDEVTAHFGASRFSYSTQGLPINVLLDTLIRPLGETDDIENKTCIKWVYDPARRVPHVVVGSLARTGGQWVDNPVKASWDIGSLSYSGMLSLPGWSFAQFYKEQYSTDLPFYSRPTRREVTDYFASYPAKVGISDAIYNNTTLTGIRREGNGFYIVSHDLQCDHLILASGIFTTLLPPRPLLRPLLSLPVPKEPAEAEPILVVGSGFSAADVIISSPPSQKIIHIFKWAPSTSPSPLRACHQRAYPEYAGIYRKMKLAALDSSKSTKRRPSTARRPSSFDLSRDWSSSYEGLPNTEITGVRIDGDSAVVTLRNEDQKTFERRVSNLEYVVGRRGSLEYLEPELRNEVCPNSKKKQHISGQDMREKANEDLEVAPNVFIIGNLTGDTLIRFAYGSCVHAAGRIMDRDHTTSSDCSGDSRCSSSKPSPRRNGYKPSMNGFDGHEYRLNSSFVEETSLDRRKSYD